MIDFFVFSPTDYGRPCEGKNTRFELCNVMVSVLYAFAYIITHCVVQPKLCSNVKRMDGANC